MKTAVCAALLALGCSTELAFQTPQSWEERYLELAAEYGLPSQYDAGQRPAEFSCAVMSPVGCLLVEGNDPAWTTFHVLDFDGVWSEPETVPTSANGVATVDLSDGTAVLVVGNLLIFDDGYTELSSCVAPNARPSESATCEL